MVQAEISWLQRNKRVSNCTVVGDKEKDKEDIDPETEKKDQNILEKIYLHRPVSDSVTPM